MIQLFLCKPTWDDVDPCTQKQFLLEELESIIWSLISSSGLSEARQWLCDALSDIKSIGPRGQRDLFSKLLQSKPIMRQLASQVLQLIFEKQPKKLGPILAKKSHMLVKFFEGNPRRISRWFSNFSSTGELGHAKGARALAQFAFINRDICWEELVWKGKHGQSPAMVATKPHYFLDLDVQQTVENFLEYVPEFWSSDEFSESLKDGDIFLTDENFFVNLFMDFMYEERQPEVWETIEEFLMEQSFSFLCRHLLISLEVHGFRRFIDLLPKYFNPKSKSVQMKHAPVLLEMILLKYGRSVTTDQLVLLNAVTNQARQLIRFVKEEGSEEENGKIRNLVRKLTEMSTSTSLSTLIAKEEGPWESIKKCGLLSWAVHLRLSEEFVTPESWESLFFSNGIEFKRCDGYDFGSASDDDGGRFIQHRKGKRRRKQKDEADESYDEDLVDINWSTNLLELEYHNVGRWFLPTDGYSTRWSTV
ncbi:hypothetical protein M569_12334, partial [Genlisea aurea]